MKSMRESGILGQRAESIYKDKIKKKTKKKMLESRASGQHGSLWTVCVFI